jgi:hypothetical protein
MADTFVERLTGQVRADDVSIEIGLVMTDAALLGDASSPARLHAEGLPGAVVPAAFARDLLRRDTNDGGNDKDACLSRAEVWVRRLFASAIDGTLVAMDSKRRLFDGQLRRFLVHRDQFCRTPWCGAPIRHADHVRPSAVGGQTTAENGQGLCAACNLTKEAPGWRSAVTAPPRRGSPPDNGPTTGRRHPYRLVEVTTPTGHVYSSTAPPVLQTLARRRGDSSRSPLEGEYQRLIDAAA